MILLHILKEYIKVKNGGLKFGTYRLQPNMYSWCHSAIDNHISYVCSMSIVPQCSIYIAVTFRECPCLYLMSHVPVCADGTVTGKSKECPWTPTPCLYLISQYHSNWDVQGMSMDTHSPCLYLMSQYQSNWDVQGMSINTHSMSLPHVPVSTDVAVAGTSRECAWTPHSMPLPHIVTGTSSKCVSMDTHSFSLCHSICGWHSNWDVQGM